MTPDEARSRRPKAAPEPQSEAAAEAVAHRPKSKAPAKRSASKKAPGKRAPAAKGGPRPRAKPATKRPAAKKKTTPRTTAAGAGRARDTIPPPKPITRKQRAAAEPAPEPEATPDAASVLNQGPEEPPMTEREQRPDDAEQPADEQAPDGRAPEEEPRRRRFLRRRRGETEAPAEAPPDRPSAPATVAPVEIAPPVDERITAPPLDAEEPEPVAAAPVPAPPPAAEHDGDHVPLAAASDTARTGEPKILLRQRFRRGLRRTRDRLGAEMREAFTGGATPESFDRLEDALVAADVGVATTAALVDDLREQIGLSDTTLSRALRDAMVKQLSEADRRLQLVRGKLSVWVIVGVNGTGKTTTIAKLGARARDLGLPVALAAADTFRAAAVEQLSEWGRRLGVEVIQQGQGADPGAVVFDALAHAKATGKRLLIVDTAGRLHTRKPLMDELQKVFRVIERDEGSVIAETLLVIDATTGQNGISQAKAFKDAVPVTGLALAKLDGSAKGGITFAVERELAVPVKAVGVGEGEKDLVPFDPETFVDALVGED
jgi:fused signal recognition particle receptor